MTHMEEGRNVVHLRELAAMCQRLAGSMTDQSTVVTLRHMAAEYETRANSQDRASRPGPPGPMAF